MKFLKKGGEIGLDQGGEKMVSISSTPRIGRFLSPAEHATVKRALEPRVRQCQDGQWEYRSTLVDLTDNKFTLADWQLITGLMLSAMDLSVKAPTLKEAMQRGEQLLINILGKPDS